MLRSAIILHHSHAVNTLYVHVEMYVRLRLHHIIDTSTNDHLLLLGSPTL